MAEIPKTYASPGLRWGLFLFEHPHAPDPLFRLARWDDPAVNVPQEWATGGEEGFTGEFCVCTVDPGDGSPLVTAWREIPSRERRGGKWSPYPKTPENWRKLTTMALGRCLKQLGLADDTEDLKALLLWRRRDVELRALAAGVSPPPALDSGSSPTDADLDRAAKSTPLAEHPDYPDRSDNGDYTPEVRDHGDPDIITIEPEDQWHAPTAAVLLPLVEQLTEAQRLTLQEFADSKGYGPYVAATGGALRALRARAASMLPKADPAEAHAEPRSPAPEAPSAPSAAPSGRPQPADPDAPAPRAMVMAVVRALHGVEEAPLAAVLADAPGLGNLTEDTGLTLGEVAQAWEVLYAHGITG